MTKQDEKKFKKIMITVFNQGVEEIILPVMEDFVTKKDIEKLATKKQLEKGLGEVNMHLDSLDRKFEAQQNRLDRHSVDIRKLQAVFT